MEARCEHGEARPLGCTLTRPKACGASVPPRATRRDYVTAVGQMVPARTPATNSEKAWAETFMTEPLTCLESRTGTIPAVAARLAATSMQLPPFELYEDLCQRGDSVVTECPFATG